ncbi:MAG: hypothetical protein NTW62_01930 [Candidatus Nomurabacteria bacterium]|nr:hypothetical protein [Candidatus Nomurabacteria bacterium]
MDMKELNKSQLILLALLISFVTSIATGISAVTLMQQAPASVTTPIQKIVRQTVEKIVPSDTKGDALTADQQKLLENLKAIQPLTVTLVSKGDSTKNTNDKILGTGLFLGNDKVVISSVVAQPKDGEIYIVKSVLGEQKISKLTADKDFTVVELAPVDTTPSSNTNSSDNSSIVPVQ